MVLLDDLSLAIAFSDVAEGSELDELGSSLLTMCAAAGEEQRLCIRMLDHEFEQHTAHLQLVLRSQSLASRVLSKHAKVVGEAYLVQTLRAPMQKLLDGNVTLEVDSHRHPESTRASEVARNLDALREWTELFASAICSEISLDAMPKPMRDVCASIDAACSRHTGPQAPETTALIGGYLVLRFFNPALVSPGGSTGTA